MAGVSKCIVHLDTACLKTLHSDSAKNVCEIFAISEISELQYLPTFFAACPIHSRLPSKPKHVGIILSLYKFLMKIWFKHNYAPASVNVPLSQHPIS